MSERETINGADGDPTKMDVPVDTIDGRKTYEVVLDSIRSDVETMDSFAIKFSILAKTPLAKVKHTIRRLPARMWAGEGRRRAERILAVVQEAGGNGSIRETAEAPAPAAAAKPPEERPLCVYCGFPLNEGDKYCGFCRTPVGAAAPPKSPDALSSAAQSAAEGIVQAPARHRKLLLLFGLLVVALCVVVYFALR